MSDDEKWATIVGNDDDADFKTSTANMAICLKKIPPEELKSLRPVKHSKKLKRSQYFVSDSCTELSFEDIQYQMYNSSETLYQKGEILKKNGKLLDKFDKLMKVPERSLSSKLEKYFSRNLISSKSLDSFEINYNEIQDDVDRHVTLRKQQKLNNHTIDIKTENDSIDDSSNILTMGNIQELIKTNESSKLFIKTTKNSFLKNIDNDFKPKMLLSTKTYTRKREKT